MRLSRRSHHLAAAALAAAAAGSALAGPCPPCERNGFPVILGWWDDRPLSPEGLDARSPRIDVDVDRAAIVWEDRSGGQGDIVLAVTEDGGCSWRTTAVTSGTADDRLPDVTLSAAAATVVVAFLRDGIAHAATSTDDGLTFSAPEPLHRTAGGDAASPPRVSSILVDRTALHVHAVWGEAGALRHARNLAGGLPGGWETPRALADAFNRFDATAPDVTVDTHSQDPALHSAVSIVAAAVAPGRAVREIFSVRSHDSGETFFGDPVDPLSEGTPLRVSDARPDDAALDVLRPVLDATDDGTGVFFTWTGVLWSELLPAAPAFGDARAEEGTTPEVIADWSDVDAVVGPAASRAAALALVPNPIGRPPDPELHLFVADESAPGEREVLASWGTLERSLLPVIQLHCGPDRLTGVDPPRAAGEVVDGSFSADENLSHAFVAWADTRDGASRVYWKRSDTWTEPVTELVAEPVDCAAGGGLRVSWTPPPSPPHCDVEHVRIDYGLSPDALDAAVLVESASDVVLEGLEPGATYHLVATVVDEACNEEPAPPVTGVVPDCDPPDPPQCPNPVGWTLRAARVEDHVALRWEPPAADGAHDPATSYDVYRADLRPQDGHLLRDNVEPPAFMDLGAATPFGIPRHFYLIVARNACGTSGDEPAP